MIKELEKNHLVSELELNNKRLFQLEYKLNKTLDFNYKKSYELKNIEEILRQVKF